MMYGQAFPEPVPPPLPPEPVPPPPGREPGPDAPDIVLPPLQAPVPAV